MLWVIDRLGITPSAILQEQAVHKIVILCALISIVPHLIPWPYSWDAMYFVCMSQAACMASLALRLCPYSQLRLKSLLAAFTAFSVLDVALYPVRYLMAPYIVYAVEVCAAFIFMLWIHNRWYNSRSDPLDDEHIFIVSRKVSNTKELIVSLFCSQPSGGFSIYARGNWYHFRKRTGIVEKTNGEVLKSLSSAYLIQSMGLADDDDIERLDAMVGGSWSYFDNCVSKFMAFDRG